MIKYIRTYHNILLVDPHHNPLQSIIVININAANGLNRNFVSILIERIDVIMIKNVVMSFVKPSLFNFNVPAIPIVIQNINPKPYNSAIVRIWPIIN